MSSSKALLELSTTLDGTSPAELGGSVSSLLLFYAEEYWLLLCTRSGKWSSTGVLDGTEAAPPLCRY